MEDRGGDEKKREKEKGVGRKWEEEGRRGGKGRGRGCRVEREESLSKE